MAQAPLSTGRATAQPYPALTIAKWFIAWAEAEDEELSNLKLQKLLYYAQGLNTTPIHSHAALFGVYGFLAIALMLFSMRHIVRKAAWDDRLLGWAFWGLNLGLVGMIVLSLLPAGFYQFAIAVKHGIWYARSPAVTGSTFIHTVTWLRIIPDVVFDAGALALVAFVAKAIFGDLALRRKEREDSPARKIRSFERAA